LSLAPQLDFFEGTWAAALEGARQNCTADVGSLGSQFAAKCGTRAVKVGAFSSLANR